MASKVIVIAFLCVALVAFVQSAPQYSQGEAPVYDDDDDADEPLKAHSSSNTDASEEEFDPSQLSEDFGTARDAGRQLNQPNSEAQSDSASGSIEN